VTVVSEFKHLEGIVQCRCSVITAVELAEGVKNSTCFQDNLIVLKAVPMLRTQVKRGVKIW